MEIGAATIRPVRLFYSYSHRDEEFRSALETHLSVLRRSGLLAEWHDGMIGAGGDWRGEIDRNLASADIVLLLVSADFIASDFCWSEEMTKALQRHERGEARVVPVILRPCRWRSTPLAKLQAVPRDGKPVTDWLNKDTAFDDVAAAVQRIIEDQQQERLRAVEEAKRAAEEECLRAEAEATREAEQQRRNAEVEARRQDEEERQQRERTEAKRAAQEERLGAEARATREAEERRRYAEVDAIRRDEKERQRREHEQTEAKRAAQEERLGAEARATREAEERRRYAEVEAIRRDEKERQRRERAKMEASQPPAHPERQWRGGSLRHWLTGGALVTLVAAVVGTVLVSQEAGKHAPTITDEPSTPAPIPAPAVTNEPSTPAPIPTPTPKKPAWKPGETFVDCAKCPEMVVIPGGTFLMGSPASEQGRDNDEGPQRQVAIAPFAIGKTEVTFAEWDACVAANDCNGYRPSDSGWGRESRPVMNVSWNDAQAYVAWLGKATNNHYRLPAEAEWEYAARAGTTTPFSFGATITTQQANYDGSTSIDGSKVEYRRQTVPVGSLPANSWELHEVHGNISEWVEDCYHTSYQGAPEDGSAWISAQCSTRVLRGGSWADVLSNIRSAKRNWSQPLVRVYYSGFRVARDLD